MKRKKKGGARRTVTPARPERGQRPRLASKTVPTTRDYTPASTRRVGKTATKSGARDRPGSKRQRDPYMGTRRLLARVTKQVQKKTNRLRDTRAPKVLTVISTGQICSDRAARREVLHAKGVAGGKVSKAVWSARSYVRCRG